MSSRYAKRCQAAYLGWCHIHGLKAASTKNFFWYVAQQSPAAQRALLADAQWGPPEKHQHGAPVDPDWDKPGVSVAGPDPKHHEKKYGPHYARRKQAWPFHKDPYRDGGPYEKYKAMAEAGQPYDKHRAYSELGDEAFHSLQRSQEPSLSGPVPADAHRKHHDGDDYYSNSEMGTYTANRKQAWSGWGPSVFPKARQVTGWKWDNHLDGYTSNSPQKFACECGNQIPTPSGFQRCACGKQWNSYVIGTSGSSREASAEKFLVREIPVRTEGNVIVAGRREACWPGCHENEAHAKKFHKKESGRHDDPYGQDDADDFSHVIPEKMNTVGGHPGMARDWGPPGEHHNQHEAVVRLVDPRTGKIHKLVDPGMDEGEEAHHNKTKVKKPPRDWAHRGDGAKWRKRTFGKG